jgi:uncharacterized protein (DUF488 family)
MTTVYTIGHSSHEPQAFVTLLRELAIELVVDVRSNPYSHYVPQANREVLASTLRAADIAYVWMGRQLGGKPEGGAIDYAEIRATSAFRQGLAEVMRLADQQRTAIMCAEGDHRRCHRHKLIAPALIELGTEVVHIQPDGSLVQERAEPRQLALF